MESPTRLPPSPSKALHPVSPERMNQQTIPASPSLPADLLTLHHKNHRGVSEVQAKVAFLNGLSRGGSPGNASSNSAAVLRANMGREEAESALATAQEELADAQDRERRISERLESLLEELHGAKERQGQERSIFEKEIRKARKEAFRAGSTMVKLQEELKNAKSEAKALKEEVASERESKDRAKQEAFERAYALAGLTEELELLKEKFRALETENHSSTLEVRAHQIRKEDFGRLSLAEGDLAFLNTPRRPKRAAAGSARSPAPERDEVHVEATPPKRPRLSEIEPATENEQPSSAANLTEEDAELLEELKEELVFERRRREAAEDMVHYMNIECQFERCSCRIAESHGRRYIYDAEYYNTFQKPEIEAEEKARAHQASIQQIAVQQPSPESASTPEASPPPPPVHRSPIHRSPVHQAPIYEAPVQQSPMHPSPVHQSPVHESSVHESPVHQSPVHESPVHQVPVHRSSVHQTPIYEAPVQQSPMHPSPVHQSPVHQSPVHQSPVHQSPVHQSPVHQAPIYEAPVQPSPVHQSPIHQSPVHESSVHESPVHQIPVHESPIHNVANSRVTSPEPNQEETEASQTPLAPPPVPVHHSTPSSQKVESKTAPKMEMPAEPLVTFSPETGTFMTFPSPLRDNVRALRLDQFDVPDLPEPQPELHHSRMEISASPEPDVQSFTPSGEPAPRQAPAPARAPALVPAPAPAPRSAARARLSQEARPPSRVQRDAHGYRQPLHAPKRDPHGQPTISNTKRVPLRNETQSQRTAHPSIPDAPIDREQALAAIRARRGRTHSKQRSVSGPAPNPAGPRRVPNPNIRPDSRSEREPSERRDMSAPVRMFRR
ncbi:unnamed protein product [Penicillium bialowiezense]